MESSIPAQVRDDHITMERDKEMDGLRRSAERDSWSEEIDPLRGDNGRDSWSGVGDHFWRDSLHTLEADTYPVDDDDIMKPNKKDIPLSKPNGDPRACERADYRREGLIMEKGSSMHYKGDVRSAGRGRYERDLQPVKGYERLSVDRAHTMKDFEKQITELKKENFNLKLRIYFLEEQMQRRCDNSSEELHRMNIELKVEVESLKHDFQEKQNLLIRASKAMESLSGEHGLTLQQLKEQHLRQLQNLEEAHQQKVQLLEEEREREKGELEKACMLLEQERRQRYGAEERLLAAKEQYSKSVGVLEDRDWFIQCLNETLRSKDSLITQLEKQINAMMPLDPPRNGLYAERDAVEGRSGSPVPACRECLATKSPGAEKEESINEWQKKVKEMENMIRDLRQKLEDNKAGLAAEEKNALKRDKAIQGLTLALKTKTKENQKLQKEVDNLNAAMAKAREAAHHHQQGGPDPRESNDPDYKKLVITIQAQQDLCSRLRQYERESGSLQKELDAIMMLRQWLEKDMQANEELRRILEAQIMARYRESDTMSFLGDQTSYLSICLRNFDQADWNREAANRPLMNSAETQTEFIDPVPFEEALHGLRCHQGNPLDRSVTDLSTAKEAFSHNASSSTKYFSDKGLLIDLSTPGSRGLAIASETLPFTDNALHTDKQQKCLSNRLTKSRIPVLLKSSLSTRLKAEAGLPSCHENSHLYNHLQSAEVEIEASNPDSPADSSHDEDYPDRAEAKCSRRDIQHGSRPNNNRLAAAMKVEVLQPEEESLKLLRSPPQKEVLHSVEGEVLLQALYKELQDENLRLMEQLQSAQMEMETLRSQVDLVVHVNTESSKSATAIADGNLPEPSVQQQLQIENLRLTEQLKCAQVDIERLRSQLDFIKSRNTESSDTAGCNLPEPSVQQQLQIENLRLTEQLKCAQIDNERLQSQVDFIESVNAECADRADGNLPEPSVQKKLQLENLRLSELLKRALMELERLRTRMDVEDSTFSRSTNYPSDTADLLQKQLQKNLRLTEQLKHEDINTESPRSVADTAVSNLPGPSFQKKLQMESLGMIEQLKREDMYAVSDVYGANTEERNVTKYQEGWIETLRLKQSSHAQVDFQKLPAEQRSLENLSVLSGLDGALVGEQSLQFGNFSLTEELKPAQMDFEKLQARRCALGDEGDIDGAESYGGSLREELQLEKFRLIQQLKHAARDSERLWGKGCMFEGPNSQQMENVGFTKEINLMWTDAEKPQSQSCHLNGASNPDRSDVTEEVWREDLRLQQMDTEEIQARRPSLNVFNPDAEEKDLLVKELTLENHRLSELLKRAQADIETLQARVYTLAGVSNLSGLDGAGKRSAAMTPQKELQVIENLRELRDIESLETQEHLKQVLRDMKSLEAKEHRKQAQMGIEGLQIQENLMGTLSPAPVAADSTQNLWATTTPQKELQVVENLRELRDIESLETQEHLKQAQMDIDGLKIVGTLSAASELGSADITQNLWAATTPEKDLQIVGNLRIAEQSKQQRDIESLETQESTMRNLNAATESDRPTSQQELLVENRRLAKQLKHAQIDTDRLQTQEHTRGHVSSSDQPTQSLVKELRSENHRLSEQLKCAQADVERLQARHVDSSDLHDNSVVKELRSENQRLSEELKRAQRDIKRLQTLAHTRGHLNASDLNILNLPNHSVPKELSLDDGRLPEELKCARIDNERPQAHPQGHTDSSNLHNNSVVEELRSENYRLFKLLTNAQIDNERLQKHMRAHIDDNSVVNELRSENYRLSELLKCAQLDVERLLVLEHTRGNFNNTPDIDTTHLPNHTLVKEWRSENQRDSKELERDQIDIERLQQHWRGHNTSDVDTTHLPDHFLVKELRSENQRISEELERAQINIERLQAQEHTNQPDHLVVKELSSESQSLPEGLKRAPIDIERLQEHTRGHVNNASDLPENLVVKELRSENRTLSEKLRCAQIDIERLQAQEHTRGHITDSDLEAFHLPDQSLVKELSLENRRLSEQLRCAQAEIEKLREEKTFLEEIGKLENLDTGDQDSEHSFIDKTITNSVSLSEIPIADPELQFTSQNVARLRCHHDDNCVECANNQETLILQTSSFRRVATVQECKIMKVSHSLRSFEDSSLSKYDLLVQSQARELSHQRQKIKESHNLSVVCLKNFINVLKAFGDLFPAASLDSNKALGVQEQLTQTVEWLKDLEYKLSDADYSEDDANSDHSADSLLYTPSRLVPGHRMWADKHGGHVLGLVEDYDALQKQILEAGAVLQEVEALVDHGAQTTALNMTEYFGNVFFEKLGRTKQSLDEAGCLLKLLWRVSLPLQSHHPDYGTRQVEDTTLEITRLRKRVVEQEKLLSGMVKRVYSENQMKEDVEKLIMERLAMTHEILKRAKGNLEVQVVDKLQ